MTFPSSTGPAQPTGNGSRKQLGIVKHNVRGQVVAMVEEELPLVEKRLVELEQEMFELNSQRDYLRRVATESGMVFDRPCDRLDQQEVPVRVPYGRP